MKKIGLIIFVVIAVGAAYWLYQHNGVSQPTRVAQYNDVINQAASVPMAIAESHSSTTISITDMLKTGIVTKQGILQSHLINQNNVDHYDLTLNSKPLNITTVSEIELVKVFAINDQQIAVIGYDQGGNQCIRQYQVITIDSKGHKLSKPFGSCLPLTDVALESNDIIFSMPQNNPYLGQDILIKYKYHAGEVRLLQKPSAHDLKQHYAQLTAAKILQIAASDSCYVDGVILDDNSCGSGRKYCVMFKNIVPEPADAAYKVLKAFCRQ